MCPKQYGFILFRRCLSSKYSQFTKITPSKASSITQELQPGNVLGSTQIPRSSLVQFEAIDLSAQPAPVAAITLIAQEPIRVVDQNITSCDGGGGALGHPKIYINLV